MSYRGNLRFSYLYTKHLSGPIWSTVCRCGLPQQGMVIGAPYQILRNVREHLRGWLTAWDTYHIKKDSKSSVSTLIERRMRGNLIETFKIMNGAVNYGQYMFHRNSAYNTRNINVASHHPTTASRDFFSNRVIKYWNQLPPPVKHASSVNAFKAGLDYFKFRKPNSPFGYWHLSEEIFTRIPDSREYKSFLMENRNSALHRNVLCWYVGGIFIFIGMGGVFF